MAADSIALDDLSRTIISAQRQTPSAPITKPQDAEPRLSDSPHLQRPTLRRKAAPRRRLLRRHLSESAHNDDGGDDGDDNPPDEELPQLPLLMRIEDVMRELSISRRTVYALINDGRLHLVRIGIRGSRVRTEEVLRLAGVNSKPLRVARLRNQGENKTAQQSS